jgi:hypothetical protein
MGYTKNEKRALMLKKKLEAESAKKKPKKSKAMEDTTELAE